MEFERLPADIWVEVISYLEPHELARCEQVCKQWCDFLRNPKHSKTIWSFLYYQWTSIGEGNEVKEVESHQVTNWKQLFIEKGEKFPSDIARCSVITLQHTNSDTFLCLIRRVSGTTIATYVQSLVSLSPRMFCGSTSTVVVTIGMAHYYHLLVLLLCFLR